MSRSCRTRQAALSRLSLLALTLAILSACGRSSVPVRPDATAPVPVTATQAGASPTLTAVRRRGYLNCGVHPGLIGFAFTDNRGEWRGFDVDFCRAMGAAIFGSADKVRFVPLTADNRWSALASGRIDVLWRNSSWTMERDTGGQFTFAGINYYDGQGFMVRRSLALNSATELTGARICVAAGSTSARHAEDWFRARGIAYTPVILPTEEAAREAYGREACDAFSADIAALAAARTTLADPQQHAILADIIAKEPLGPVTRRGDEQWTAVVRWTLNAVVLAEEMGVTQGNARDLARTSGDPRVRRLLGSDDSAEVGARLGLSRTWALDAVSEVGNYGDIFERNLGHQSALDLARGLNAQWNARPAGLIYGLPID